MSENTIVNGGMIVGSLSQGSATLFTDSAGVLHSTSTMLTSSFASIPEYEQLIGSADVPAEHFDHMYRVRTDSMTQSVVGHSWETTEFFRGLSAWMTKRAEEVGLLQDFANWQKSKLDYTAVHTAWLMEGITLEEYMVEAEKFATEISEQDPRRVADVADRLTKLLPFELSTSELAEFLQAEPRAVLDSIAMFGQHSEKLRALLPDDKKQLLSE